LREEEDLDFSRLFPILLRLLATQPATIPSPDGQKQPKPSLFKMQLRLFFFYHTKNNLELQKFKLGACAKNRSNFHLKALTARA
jgi:hypothetical protein